MKRLTLLRHAKSSWNDPKLDDFDRPVSERGRKAARRIGRELHDRHFRFDLVLASTAARVRETIEEIGQKFDFAAPIEFDQRMYMASQEMLLGMVRKLPESVVRPLLVGHNPGLQRLLVDLSRSDEADLRRRVVHKFPTAALAVVELPIEHWAEIEAERGTIVELILPKVLD